MMKFINFLVIYINKLTFNQFTFLRQLFNMHIQAILIPKVTDCDKYQLFCMQIKSIWIVNTV